MKIHIKAIEIETDMGRRAIQLTTPITVDPTSSEMPPVFGSLADLFWNIVRQCALESPEFMKSMSKAEA